MNIAVNPTKISKSKGLKEPKSANQVRQTIHQKKRDRDTEDGKRRDGASPGNEVSSVGNSTDSGELTIKVGKLLDNWIEVK